MPLAKKMTPTLPCLRGFEHVNRYLDKQKNKVVAKILPGEFYVSRSDEIIATTLGSCVSACIWDEYSSIGGMNHFMLPLTKKETHEVTWGNDQSDATRFGNYAMEHLINEILACGGLRKNLRAKVFGGGKILENMSDVGEKNCAFLIEYLAVENIPILSHDFGNNYPRKIMFDPLSGKAHMKRLKSMHNNTLVVRESNYQNSIVSKPVEGEIELF